MIADLKPYGAYKDSGIAWAQSLPSTWGTERAKWLFTKMARPVRPEDEVVTCFRDGMVTLRKNRRLRGFTEAIVESGYQGIRKGELVIHGMDTFAGAIGVSDSDGKGTPVYNACQPRSGINPHYYAHAVREMSQSQWILALAKGIRDAFNGFPIRDVRESEGAAFHPTSKRRLCGFWTGQTGGWSGRFGRSAG
jgi:type I restriction enzyme S subunit